MEQLLFETLFGSHLYGTNTPTSDLDIKRIVLPDIDHLLLGKPLTNRVKKTNTAKNTKNSVDDVDQEDIPLQVFMQDFVAGQTYAIELAFAIDGTHARQVVHDARMYKLVAYLRTSFLTSNVKSMMGYVFNQANIYSFKGERLNCAREFRDLLITQFTDKDAGDDQLHDCLPDPGLTAYKENLASLSSGLAGSRKSLDTEIGNSYKEFYGEELGAQVELQRNEHLAKFKALEVKYPKYFQVTEYDIGEGRMRPCFKVLEKTFPWSNTLGHSIDVADTLIKKYGTRANEASANNVDWKAMMHAVRIIDEGIELLTTHRIVLPRPPEQVARLLQIKRGELPLDPLKDELVAKLDSLKELSAASGLPLSTAPEFKERLERFMLAQLRELYQLPAKD